MKDIEKSLKLYGMMADRLEKSGHAPRQARVYREMVEFMRDCETAAEAAEKIKNSPYFLAPGAALLQDKLGALERGARENDMDDVAEVYRKKIGEIDDDVQAMYVTGYEMTARNLKIPYIQTWEAFSTIYDCYVTLSCCSAADKVAIKSALQDLREALGKLTKPSADFAVLAALPRFRRLIAATDEGYRRFVEAVPRLAAQGADFSAEERQIGEDLRKTSASLPAENQAVKEAGRDSYGRVRRAQVLVLAPDSKDGRYTYTGEEVMNFE